MEMARAHVIFKGRVQGVNFRAFVQRTAGALELNGWVRNLPDGTVEAVFEWGRDSVEEAIKKCRTGPAFANVTEAVIKWHPYEKDTKSGGGFSIRY